ncbi:urease accessory protein UreE [Lactobacillus sp. PV034]|uniref:urease accessory protein UreE n=1 Tax=Lactobacillus sp. PV034 TaxID=2594495 RepID=UPI002240BDD9|nr:urease accessory protein UreE [Lactobacillus sp. PV034]QNQ80929.1 urease accessory protein UreE [Lactobacillus sp. PV034]
MILTEIYRNVDDIPKIDSYHIETAVVKSDDLLKSILRVKSDHGNEYGIRLENKNDVLENGSAFLLGDKHLLVLSVLADEAIVIRPKDIDQMGVIAHLLGNLHKPVEVKNGEITLLLDKVVVNTLEKENIDYSIEKIKFDKPLKYVDLSNGQ